MKIAIASGKGGTGKTTLATNLAHYLSEVYPVVLADLDVEEPNSALFLNCQKLHNETSFKAVPAWEKDICVLCGKCQELCAFNAIKKLGDYIVVFPELCHSCHACSELCPQEALPMRKLPMGTMSQYRCDSLDFVEGRLAIGQEQAVPLIADTLRFLNSQYDQSYLQILDSPPGTSCPVIKASSQADLVILISEPTPFGLHDLKLACETMREIGKSFVVVINRMGIGNDDLQKFCLEHAIPIIAKIPNDRYVAELYSAGKLIYPHHPEFTMELTKIHQYLKGLPTWKAIPKGDTACTKS